MKCPVKSAPVFGRPALPCLLENGHEVPHIFADAPQWPPCNYLSNTGVMHPDAKPPCNGVRCALCERPANDPRAQGLHQKQDELTAKHNDRFAGLNLHEALLASGTVRRYHTHPHVLNSPQTVAEHSFRCAALMMSLWPEHQSAALRVMLCHDGAEGATGDISSTVKRLHPDLSRIMDGIEEGVQVRTGMPLESDLDLEGQTWVRICDWLEGAFYAIDQIAMGNRGMYMCHNAFIHSINKLPMTREVREVVREAHHRYIRHPGNGLLKVDLGVFDLIEPPLSDVPFHRNDM